MYTYCIYIYVYTYMYKYIYLRLEFTHIVDILYTLNGYDNGKGSGKSSIQKSLCFTKLMHFVTSSFFLQK